MTAFPDTWAEQTRASGVIAAAGTASGPTGDRRALMPMRDQAPAAAQPTAQPRETRTSLEPRKLAAGQDGLAVAIAELLRRVSGGSTNTDGIYRLEARKDASYAPSVARPPPGGAKVSRSGPHNLRHENTTAHHRWMGVKRPEQSPLRPVGDPRGTHVRSDRPIHRWSLRRHTSRCITRA